MPKKNSVGPVDDKEQECNRQKEPGRSFPLSCIIIVMICVAVWVPTAVGIIMQAVTYGKDVRKYEGSFSLMRLHEVRTSVTRDFQDAEMVVKGWDNMFFSKTLGMSDTNLTVKVAQDFLTGFNLSTAVWLTTKQGGLFGAFAGKKGLYTSTCGNEYNAGFWSWKDGNTYTYCKDSSAITLDSISDYNNSQGSWYQVVKPELGSECWTEPYIYSSSTMISYSHASFQDNQLLGVVGLDLSLETTQHVVETFQIDTGIILLVDQANRVWGVTDSSISLFKLLDGFEVPIEVSDIDIPKVQKANALVTAKYGTWFNAAEHGFSQWVTSSIYSTAVPLIRPCVNWSVIAIDEPVFKSADWRFPVVSILITLVFVAFTFTLVTYQVSKPLSSVERAMRAVVGLDFSPVPQFSRVSEINGMISTFSSLRTGVFAMTKYVPKPLVKEILTSNVTDLLTMKPAHLTIMFCDIQGFSGISERYPKAIVAEILRVWFACFSEVIMKNNGCIDKYIGDCIMAIWGAPEPLEMSEQAACLTAIEFNAALANLNASFPEKYPQLSCRVGIHSGNLLVGNIGYEQRINYTVCGNVANLAARLEQAGKIYGVSPLVSGQIYKTVKADFVCVWLDAVVLRGYQARVTHVFHLVAKKSEAMPEQIKASQLMLNIRRSLKLGDYKASTQAISLAESEPCMEPYSAVLSILDEHCIQQDFLKIDQPNNHRRFGSGSRDKSVSLSSEMTASSSRTSLATPANNALS
ncbi:adenylate/guanylate cyclase with integral membrane sensor [Pelomyxa schiedti]|nr:adenylate/guanylate cyclase with integral membrane sensor [Pelomyxa schiedti]